MFESCVGPAGGIQMIESGSVVTCQENTASKHVGVRVRAARHAQQVAQGIERRIEIAALGMQGTEFLQFERIEILQRAACKFVQARAGSGFSRIMGLPSWAF